jgi:hypothetical protein
MVLPPGQLSAPILLFSAQVALPSVYPELFALTGPNVPDYRGLFLRGYGSRSHSQNNGSTVGVTATTHSSAGLGTVQGDAIRDITAKFHSDFDLTTHGFAGAAYGDEIYTGGADNYDPASRNLDVYFSASRIVPTANENRPVNTAVRYLIRAKP